MAAGGDDDDFAQLAVEEVSVGESDQEQAEAAELSDSAQTPEQAQPTRKPRKKACCSLLC